MLGLRERKTRKTREMMSDVISYADEVVRDERMRSDLRSALDHGLAASRRLADGSGMAGLGERLDSDKKLRKDVRAMLDDLERAADRARRRTSHRARNTILVVGAAGMAVAGVVGGRRWVEAHWSTTSNGSNAPQDVPAAPLVD